MRIGWVGLRLGSAPQPRSCCTGPRSREDAGPGPGTSGTAGVARHPDRIDSRSAGETCTGRAGPDARPDPHAGVGAAGGVGIHRISHGIHPRGAGDACPRCPDPQTRACPRPGVGAAATGVGGIGLNR